MRFPDSMLLGLAKAPDGSLYNLDFYGENEGAAVVTGPKPPPNSMVMAHVPEVYREDADGPADAWVKLMNWIATRGWILFSGQCPVYR